MDTSRLVWRIKFTLAHFVRARPTLVIRYYRSLVRFPARAPTTWAGWLFRTGGREKRGEKSGDRKNEMSAGVLISNLTLYSLISVACPPNTIIIPIISRARSRHERISIRVASRAETDCHRPFHVAPLILDQRSRRKRKKKTQHTPPPILPMRDKRCTRTVTDIDIALPMRDISRYIFNSPPFIRPVIRFITPSITRHSYWQLNTRVCRALGYDVNYNRGAIKNVQSSEILPHAGLIYRLPTAFFETSCTLMDTLCPLIYRDTSQLGIPVFTCREKRTLQGDVIAADQMAHSCHRDPARYRES